jgi:hypothetical protein
MSLEILEGYNFSNKAAHQSKNAGGHYSHNAALLPGVFSLTVDLLCQMIGGISRKLTGSMFYPLAFIFVMNRLSYSNRQDNIFLSSPTKSCLLEIHVLLLLLPTQIHL